LLFIAFAFVVNYTYTKDQLMEPAVLAKALNDPKAKKPVVLNVGSVKDIKTAIHAGPSSIKTGVDLINAALPKIKKTESIVIYCGCCALEHCENIPPALEILKKAGYKKVKILNLPVGLDEDWKAKGYPMK
jgi:thiosulfate/3-mercaptopyruvate sulfurtransferase